MKNTPKKWIWFYERIGRKKGKLYGYLFNPYFKNAQECLNLFNCIDNFANKELTLKDVYIIWED